MKFIENRLGLFLAYSSPFVRRQVDNVPLDLVELLNSNRPATTVFSPKRC